MLNVSNIEYKYQSDAGLSVTSISMSPSSVSPNPPSREFCEAPSGKYFQSTEFRSPGNNCFEPFAGNIPRRFIPFEKWLGVRIELSCCLLHSKEII